MLHKPYITNVSRPRNESHNASSENTRPKFTIHATITSTKIETDLKDKKFKTNEDNLLSFSSILSTRQHRLKQDLLRTQGQYQMSNMTMNFDDMTQSSWDCRSVGLDRSSNDNLGQSGILKSSKQYPHREYDNQQTFIGQSFSKSNKVVHSETDRSANKTGLTNERPTSLNETKEQQKRKYLKGIFPCVCSIPCRLVSLLIGLLLIGLIIGSIVAALIGSRTTSTTTTTSTTLTTTIVPTTFCSCLCANESIIFDSGFLARWTFDNTLTDITNVYNATSYNNPSFVTNGYVNQALFLDASLIQSLSAPYIPLAYTSFTIEVWLQPTLFPNPEDHSILGLCPNTAPNQCLHLVIRQINSNHYLYFGFFANDCQGNTPVTLNQWIHAAFIFDITTLTQSIYVNGILDNSCTASSPIIATTGSVTIGTVPGLIPLVNMNFYQGYIDHLTITKRAKSSCEILEDATLVACFLFDGASPYVDSGPNSLLSTELSTSIISSGHSGQAISFNGTSYFQVSNLTAMGLNNETFSLSLWIRPRSVLSIILHVSSFSSGQGWCVPFLVTATNGSIIAQMYSGTLVTIWSSSVPMSPIWSHIVETWSPTNGLRLYINGALVSSLPSVTSYTASMVSNFITLGNALNGSNFCIGSVIGTSAAEPFDGDMDSFQVYSRELTAANIYTIYQSE